MPNRAAEVQIAQTVVPAQTAAQDTVVDLIERQCERTPDRVAVVFERQELTYGELHRRSNQLANYLCDRGVRPESLVTLCIERSAEMVIALLGILKAGAAYVPLDPDYPEARLRYMLDDSAAPVLLTQSRVLPNLPITNQKLVCLDAEWEQITSKSGKRPDVSLRADNLLYVIYTSGSTGQPKGVMVEHGGFSNLMRCMVEAPGIESGDVQVAVSALSFDMASVELLLPLTVGARTVVSSRDVGRDARRLRHLLEECGATMMLSTPSRWQMLIEVGWMGGPHMKVRSGGEALSRWLAEALLDRASSVWNGYGPTETSACSTWARVERGAGPVSIGRPIANTEIRIVGERGEPVPVGDIGEIYIGGAGVARGYWKRPELTAERFVKDPCGSANSRWYRSGDLARFGTDGSIEFVGRTDTQVKVRGHRVELGEIEAALLQAGNVREAVVVSPGPDDAPSHLVAYILPDEKAGLLSSEKLRAYLHTILPEYMIPARFIQLAELPHTPNGKIDRRALADLEGREEISSSAFVAPANENERILADIFERVLSIRPVSITANFFDLGGNSFLAVRLFSEIDRIFNRHLPLATIFRAPTIQALSAVLDEDIRSNRWSPLVPVQPKGCLRPFFCVDPAGPSILRYHGLAHLLGPEQPFYALQPLGLNPDGDPPTSIEEMAAEYIANIRTIQPEGPYNVGGWSFGGVIALEMAQQLRAAGQHVSLLALFDSFFPNEAKHFQQHRTPWSRQSRIDRFIGELLFRPRRQAWDQARDLASHALRQTYGAVARLIAPKLVRRGPYAQLLARAKAVNARAGQTYVPKCYPGRIVLFWCMDWGFRSFHDRRLAWSDIAEDGLEVHVTPGTHSSAWEPPHVKAFAQKLRHCLQVSRRAT